MGAGVFQIRQGNRAALRCQVLVIKELVSRSMQAPAEAQLPHRADDTVYGTTFFTLTDSTPRVAKGVIVMMVVLVRSTGGQFSAQYHGGRGGGNPSRRRIVNAVWLALFTTPDIVR